MEVSKFAGSGFSFLQSRLSKVSDEAQETMADTPDQIHEPQRSILSETAKVLLTNLLKQENVNLTNPPSTLLVPLKSINTYNVQKEKFY